MRGTLSTLRDKDIQATPQRVAVAEYILETDTHPSADEVWTNVKRGHPSISRATVYNTLNLLVEKGLLRTQVLREGTVVFDPQVQAHHHFIDEETDRIYDVPLDAVRVSGEDTLDGLEVREYQVVMRGRVKKLQGRKHGEA